MPHPAPSPSRPGPIERPYIFVSYARANRDAVYPEVERLERAGYQLWCDRSDIPTGRPWFDEITTAIRNCDCFLIFLSERSVSSENVRDELHEALRSRRFIIPIYLEKLGPREDLEKLGLTADLQQKLGSIQGIESFALRRSKYEENLFVALFDCVGAPRPKPSAARGQFADRRPEYIAPRPERTPSVASKIIFICMFIACIFAGFLAFIAFIMPDYLTIDREDPAADRQIGWLLGSFFSVIAAGLALAAFLFYWLHLRRNDG
jgi:hypothetical protein